MRKTRSRYGGNPPTPPPLPPTVKYTPEHIAQVQKYEKSWITFWNNEFDKKYAHLPFVPTGSPKKKSKNGGKKSKTHKKMTIMNKK